MCVCVYWIAIINNFNNNYFVNNKISKIKEKWIVSDIIFN